MTKKRGQNEGTIYQRADGRWEAKITIGYVNGARKRKSYYGDTRREVKEQMTAALHQQQLPERTGQLLARI